ncbi:MAG TPA: cytochrome P450 [Kribbella sp.]|jgi:cytochrome P450
MGGVSVIEPVWLGRGFIQDPHKLYEQLREAGPVSEVLVWGGVAAWLVTRYAEARQLLNDPRLGKDHHRILELFPPELAGAHSTPMSAHMLHSDPPDHTRLRRLVSKAFTARTVAGLRPEIEQITEELLEEMTGAETVDLIESFALPLPIRVISALLGVPKRDHTRLRDWANPLLTEAEAGEIARAQVELADYLHGLVTDKRADPADDLVSALVGVSEQGDQLSTTELINMIFLLIIAGYETTVNLIGNGVLSLLRDPARLAEVRADATLLPGTVEELLRLDSPLNLATNRYTIEPVTVGEVTIPANQIVLVSLLSANHDGAQFAEPDHLDVHRETNPHLAFGHGIHYCLGAPLARLEGEIAIGRLLHRFPALSLDVAAPAPRYRLSTLMRGLSALPVRLTG